MRPVFIEGRVINQSGMFSHRLLWKQNILILRESERSSFYFITSMTGNVIINDTSLSY